MNWGKSLFGFTKTLISTFLKGDTFEKGAALAYYTVFSFLPMAAIIISILGSFFGDQAVEGEFAHELYHILGKQGAERVEDLIKSHHTNYNNTFTGVLGFFLLAVSSTAMFNQLQKSFNNLWKIKPNPQSSIFLMINTKITSFLILLFLGFVLFISVSMSYFLHTHGLYIENTTISYFFLEHVISYFLIILLFSVMIRFLGDAVVPWKTALMGGIFTATFFLIGKLLITYILKSSSSATAFGSASILAIGMLWVYYTSQTIFLGALFAMVWGERNNAPIQPTKNAAYAYKEEELNKG